MGTKNISNRVVGDSCRSRMVDESSRRIVGIMCSSEVLQFLKCTKSKKVLKLLASSPVKKTGTAVAAAYLYVVVPHLIGTISRATEKKQNPSEVITRIKMALKNALLPDRFPAFAAKLVGGTYLADFVLKSTKSRLSNHERLYLSALMSSVIAHMSYKRGMQVHPRYAADVSEMTWILAVRALDMVLRRASHGSMGKRFVRTNDVLLFTLSSFVIMFSWFYYPERLPKGYRRWITMAANMDDALVEALRLLRQHKLLYGKHSENERMLVPLCKKYGMPEDFGDMSKTSPIPCILVHQNSYTSCEMHALWRLARGFRTGMSLYVPINVLSLLLRGKMSAKSLRNVFVGSARSSLFLAAFITLNWYSVCLVRTRLGPRILPNATSQQLDDTWGPGLGSLLSGLSCLIENDQRRGELALFVAPKAVSVVLSNNSRDLLETLVFAVSFATLFTGVRGSPQHVRGVFGKLLKLV